MHNARSRHYRRFHASEMGVTYKIIIWPLEVKLWPWSKSCQNTSLLIFDELSNAIFQLSSSIGYEVLLLELYTNMSEPGILDKWAGSDPSRLHFKILLTEPMQDSSFYVEGTETLARPRKGVKPGDALADLLFSLLLAPILERIAHDLDAVGLLLRPAVAAHTFRSTFSSAGSHTRCRNCAQGVYGQGAHTQLR